MFSRTTRCTAVWVLALGLAGAVTGCGSPASPGTNAEVVNVADHFSYQVSNIQNYTSTMSYSWSNGGTQANVNQACAVSAGAAVLVVLDGAGVQVYSRSLADNGTFTTAAGTPGTWTIRVIYDGASATVNFRADMTT